MEEYNKIYPELPKEAPKDGKTFRLQTVCMVFIPNVVMAKLLAHVSITHDNNNCFGSLYQYFSFGNEMVGRF